MSAQKLHSSLLRPPVLHILRAAGFHSARPAALDTLVDLTSRYLTLLAKSTAAYAVMNHNDLTPTTSDFRMALQELGGLVPQYNAMEEQCAGQEDMRGVEAFLQWMTGEANGEIRRIAGMAGTEGEITEVEAGKEREDFLTALKKKHSKTGEESRYQGTVLGKESDEKPVRIEGGPIESIEGWEAKMREHGRGRMLKPDAIRRPSNNKRNSSGSSLFET